MFVQPVWMTGYFAGAETAVAWGVFLPGTKETRVLVKRCYIALLPHTVEI